MRYPGLVCLIVIVLMPVSSASFASASFDHEHGAWTLLTKNHVRWNNEGTATEVDYAGFKSNRDVLTRYLQTLSAVSRSEFDGFSSKQQLAFLINAYNAFTIELILSEYPDVNTIKDLGSLFSSPWKKKFIKLFGEKQHLDGIEHDLIRGTGLYNEPLIHFAVNCASIGCPALINEAFVAEKLEQQLLESTRRFLRDRSRNRFDAETGTLEVSSIFDWYAEDFAQGWRGYDSLHDFFRTHAGWVADNADAAERLKNGSLKINFLDYDWTLNDYR